MACAFYHRARVPASAAATRRAPPTTASARGPPVPRDGDAGIDEKRGHEHDDDERGPRTHGTISPLRPPTTRRGSSEAEQLIRNRRGWNRLTARKYSRHQDKPRGA